MSTNYIHTPKAVTHNYVGNGLCSTDGTVIPNHDNQGHGGSNLTTYNQIRD